MKRQLHLHLGAHKTATTHLQNTLYQLSKTAEGQYYYVPNARFRRNVTHGNRFLNPKFAGHISRYLHKLAAGDYQNLIVSEENLIGEAKDFLKKDTLYAEIDRRLGALAQLLPSNRQLHLWLFIRTLKDFIPSIYCEYLRHWPYQPFETILHGHYEQSWIATVQSLQTHFPEAAIYVVNFDVYQPLAARILSSFTGTKINPKRLKDRVLRPRLSHTEVKLASRLPGDIPTNLRRGILSSSALLGRHLATSKPYSPFSEDVRDMLDARFQEDLEQLRSMSNVTLLDASSKKSKPVGGTS